MVQEKIQRILIFSLFLSIGPKRKEEKELEIRMFMSFSAERISTRRVMVFKMNNPWRNDVVLCRRESANSFKIGKELNKGKHIWKKKSRAKNAKEFWKNFRVLKSFQQQRRRFKSLKQVGITKRSRCRRCKKIAKGCRC